jgi:hypothetical protein
MVQPIPFIASSMDNDWFKPTTYIDYPDTGTGITNESCILGGGEEDVHLLDPYAHSSAIESRRVIARNVRSTMPHNFLSLFQTKLAGWNGS